MERDATRWVENRPSSGARALDLGELWAYRELVGFLALRDLKARYKQAAFGVGWAVLQPVVTAAVFTVVFHQLADVPSDGVPYVVFALLGSTVWSYFSTSLNRATSSLVGNASLITKVYFPRIAATLAALLPGLVDLAIGLLLVALVMAVTGVTPGPALLALPLCVAGLLVVALGAGLVLATLNVTYRDVGSVFGLLTQAWLFASPVAYPSDLVDGWWRWLYAANPMAGVLDAFRWALLGTARPGAELLVSAAAGLALGTAGVRYFQGAERRFADVI